MTTLRVKICGITKPDQGIAIAQLGASALGFICVQQSPRYIPPLQIRTVVEAILETNKELDSVSRVGVFVNASLEEIIQGVAIGHLTAVQLHGDESPQFCAALRDALPTVEMIRAFRIRNSRSLDQVHAYTSVVNTLLLDAYHPHLLGGTGHTLDWSLLQAFRPDCAWFLAGGITPTNVLEALSQVHPDGIDLSSGVEQSPGNKDLIKVKQLFDQLNQRSMESSLHSQVTL